MTGKPSVDVLLFDLGGVLIDFAGFAELPRLVPGRPDASIVRQRWIDSETVHIFERGDIGPAEFARRFLGEWGLVLSPELFLSELTSWARGPYPGATDLLEELCNRYRIACLSNSNELHTSRHREAVGRYMERLYFSNEVGLAKPDPEMFCLAIRDLGVPADRIAFFDDTAVNVEVATQAGMNAYLTDGIDELRRCLEQMGIVST